VSTEARPAPADDNLSARWWGIPGLIGVGLGILELVTSSVLWGLTSLVVGALLLAHAWRRYRQSGRL
jgi:Flp pilus assembly protein TadB